MEASEALAQLGLSGSYQLHQAPSLLTIDQRAHQVFSGFTSGAQLKAALRWRISKDAVFHLVGETSQEVTLSGLPDEITGVVVLPASDEENPGGLYGLVWVVDRLLGPGGCPWDQEQTHESLKKHLIEESYELCEAIDEANLDKMREELGDVLLQPLMHTQMQRLEGGWDIDAVAQTITEKLIRRHPHVFGDVEAADADEVLRNWNQIKLKERGEKPGSILDGVPKSMPALMRAMEISKRAAREGFEWPSIDAVWDKVGEEQTELNQAIASGEATDIESELGDLLFSLVNIARWLRLDPEQALMRMVDRFVRRFREMEAHSDRPLRELTPEEWNDLWERSKARLG